MTKLQKQSFQKLLTKEQSFKMTYKICTIFIKLNKKLTNILFSEFEKSISDNFPSVKYSYFEIDGIYYIFICSLNKNLINLEFFEKHSLIKKKLIKREFKNSHKKPRVLRSARGFLLLALELQANRKETFTVLETNLEQDFWSEIEKRIRYNQPHVLRNFLFSDQSLIINNTNKDFNNLYDSVQKLQAQVNELVEINKKLVKSQNENKSYTCFCPNCDQKVTSGYLIPTQESKSTKN